MHLRYFKNGIAIKENLFSGSWIYIKKWSPAYYQQVYRPSRKKAQFIIMDVYMTLVNLKLPFY